ncbi:MAG: carotenoid 1,2-hydratase [Acetobacteraceae bacterium]|nr:carotenoid 1,2-hydratase [Acetobacteraceae bacterium]MDW8398334.1 carotenoid 1,2-hydratase [Acetobacteraceae bacterium]
MALNVALYGRPRRWALTDRGRGAARQEPMRLGLGPSSLAWDGETLVVSVAEVTAPVPRPLRGEVRITPGPVNRRVFTLDAAGRHRWCPMAPACRAEVAFEAPALRWSGTAYLDGNWGDAPLEADFVDWDWSRFPLPDGAAVFYDTRRRDGSRQSLALRFDRAGGVEELPPPPFVRLPRSLWGVARRTQADPGASVAVLRTLEDTPFYARSVVRTRLFGAEVEGVHESLDLDRFRALPIRLMLPFKVPRAWLW